MRIEIEEKDHSFTGKIVDKPIFINNEIILVDKEVWKQHTLLRERVEMKLRQLQLIEQDESFAKFGGPGSESEDAANRPAYIKVLQWILGKEEV